MESVVSGTVLLCKSVCVVRAGRGDVGNCCAQLSSIGLNCGQRRESPRLTRRRRHVAGRKCCDVVRVVFLVRFVSCANWCGTQDGVRKTVRFCGNTID